MLDEAEQKGDAVLTIVKANRDRNPLEKDADGTRNEINAIDDLRGLLVRLDDNERNGAPIYMRFGLYSGDRIYKSALLPIYFNAVEKRFKEPVIRKLEDDLEKFNASQITGTPEQQEAILGKHYDLLKAYLMLSGEYKDKADPTTLKNALKDSGKPNRKRLRDGIDRTRTTRFLGESRLTATNRRQISAHQTGRKSRQHERVKLKEFPPVFVITSEKFRKSQKKPRKNTARCRRTDSGKCGRGREFSAIERDRSERLHRRRLSVDEEGDFRSRSGTQQRRLGDGRTGQDGKCADDRFGKTAKPLFPRLRRQLESLC